MAGEKDEKLNSLQTSPHIGVKLRSSALRICGGEKDDSLEDMMSRLAITPMVSAERNCVKTGGQGLSSISLVLTRILPLADYCE